MNNYIILNKITDIVCNNDIHVNKKFNVKSVEKFLYKFAKQNNNVYILYLTYDNTNLYYLVTRDNEKIRIQKLDYIDVVLYESFIRNKTVDERINNIIENAEKHFNKAGVNLTAEKISELKKMLKFIGNNVYYNNFFVKKASEILKQQLEADIDSYLNKNVINEQEGGVLIKMLEDHFENQKDPTASMILTGILEFIDLLLMLGSAIPIIGTPVDVLSILYAILRGTWTDIIPDLIGFIPVIGDVVGTIMKVFTKFTRISGKITKYTAKLNKLNKMAKKAKKALDVVG